LVEFGKQLREMRQKAGWSQDELTERMSRKAGYRELYTRDHIKDVELGYRRPSRETLMGLLKVFAGQPFGLHSPWEVQQWVSHDGLVLSQEELHELFPDWPAEGLMAGLGREKSGRASVPTGPEKHVARRLQDEVVEAVTAVGEGGQAVWRVVILYGLAGIGKTTLAISVAHDERVGAHFPDGVLWVEPGEGKPEQWLDSLCTALQLNRERREGWAACWQRWVGESGRRCLLVVDDAVEGRRLGPLLAGLGPGVVVLVTTQQGVEIRAEVGRWVSPDEIREIGVRGLEVEEGRRLVELYVGRELEVGEWEEVQKIGELVGWHPESLRLAAVEGGERGWPVVLKDLESAGVALVTVDMMLERQWRRLEEKTQQRLLALVRWLNHGKCFGVRYGAAVWGVETEVAELCLEQLEGTGLVERMENKRDVLGWVQELWRVTPVAWRRWGSEGGENLWQTLKRMYPRWRLYRRMKKEGWQELEAPWRYQVVNTVWGSLSIVKGIVALPLWIIGWLRRDWAWYERWMNWTILLRAERRLKDYWRRAGIEPVEEMWLIYDARETVGVTMFLLQMLGAIGLGFCGLGCLWVQLQFPSVVVEKIWWFLGGALWIAALLLCLGGIWWISWRTWIAYLYGLETWDLRLIAGGGAEVGDERRAEGGKGRAIKGDPGPGVGQGGQRPEEWGNKGR